jgi:hypothetical protein
MAYVIFVSDILCVVVLYYARQIPEHNQKEKIAASLEFWHFSEPLCPPLLIEVPD